MSEISLVTVTSNFLIRDLNLCPDFTESFFFDIVRCETRNTYKTFHAFNIS